MVYSNCSCPDLLSIKHLPYDSSQGCNLSFYKPGLCISVQPDGLEGTVCEICQTCLGKCSCVDITNRSVHQSYINVLISSNGISSDQNVCSSFPIFSYYYKDMMSICCKQTEIEEVVDRGKSKAERLQSIVRDLLIKEHPVDSRISDKTRSSMKRRFNSKLEDTFKQLLDSLQKLVKVSQEINEDQQLLDGDLKGSIDRILSPIGVSQMHSKYKQLLDYTKSLDSGLKSKKSKINNNSTVFNSSSGSECNAKLSCGRMNLKCCNEHLSVADLQGPLRLSHYSGLACATNKSLQFYYMDSDVHKHLLNRMGVDESRPSLMVVDMAQEERYILDQNLLLEFTSIGKIHIFS